MFVGDDQVVGHGGRQLHCATGQPTDGVRLLKARQKRQRKAQASNPSPQSHAAVKHAQTLVLSVRNGSIR
jgi:hypothetical protein